LRGVLLLLGAALLFSVMSLLVKVAGRRLPPEEIVLARAVITFVISLAMVKKGALSLLGNARGLLALRGLFGFGGLYCFFTAVTLLPLAEITVIHYLNPVFTALFAALALREALRRNLLVALGLSLAGVVLVAQSGFLFGNAGALPTRGVLFALAGAVFAALAYTTVRRLRKTDDPLVIVFWFSLVALPLSIPLVWPVFVMPQGNEWAVLLGIGLCTQAAQIFLTRGIALVPAGPATAVGYIQIVLAAFWGFVFFDEVPNLLAAVGALLVIGALFFLVFSSRQKRVPSTQG
jgi:drug/metabolite transporter (DMT)-like permease